MRGIMHKKITISVDQAVLKEFDGILGIVSRSAYINNMMRLAVQDTHNHGE